MAHLELGRVGELLFVDPENAIYDATDMNRGFDRTFFNPSTPFAFLDRFTRKDGTKELGEVLSKWSNGTSKMALSFLGVCDAILCSNIFIG